MITVGKVRDAEYYLQEVTADDAHSYYADRKQSGQWRGRFAEFMGLEGEVDGEHFTQMLAGLRPGSSRRLAETAVQVTALDVTLSVPKSVSVLWATVDGPTRSGIEAAIDQAELAVVSLIEAEATQVRRGHAGVEIEPGYGLAAASFDHRTSRLGDPNLHRHLVVANATIALDFRVTGLDTRQLYRIRYTAESVFQSVLRHALATEVGCQFDDIDRHGVGEIVGVGKEIRDEFSQRRKAIETEMARHGATTGRGARVAALTTRPAKPQEPAEEILVESWRQRAAAIGFDVATVPLTPRSPDLDVTDDDLAFTLTERESTYGRRDVIRHTARSAPDGATYDTIIDRAEHYLQSEHAIEIRPDVFTTPEILAIESECAAMAQQGQWLSACRIDADHGDYEIRRRPHLDDDQRHMVHTITTSGSRVEVVIGPPGTGKTTSLAAVNDAYAHTDHQLIGAALAARTARQLENETGIRSMTIDRLLTSLDRGQLQLDASHLVVIDEAAMVGTRQLATVMDSVKTAGAKIVLVGDPSQLPAIDTGGVFAAIARRIEPIVLRHNRRQSDVCEMHALDALRQGDIDTAIANWQAAGRIHAHETADLAIEAIVDAWHTTHSDGDASVMVAARHDQLRQLNHAARARLTAENQLGPIAYSTPDIEFSIGDKVMTLQNDYRHDLINGHIGTLVDRTPDGLVIDIGTRRLTVPEHYIEDGQLTHAYAITVHKAQGATVDHIHHYADDSTFNELGYTAMSRGRHTNHLHTVASRDEHGRIADDPLRDLRYGLNISRAKTAAIDQLPPERTIDGPGIDLW